MKLRQSLNWMLEKYIKEYDELKAEVFSENFGRTFLSGKMVAVKDFIEELQEILEEGEDE